MEKIQYSEDWQRKEMDNLAVSEYWTKQNRREIMEVIWKTAQKYPSNKTRRIFFLHYQEGKSIGELALQEGCSTANIKYHLKKMIQYIRKRLKGVNYEELASE